MHLQVRLPKVEPAHIEPPSQCPFRDRKNRKKPCAGTHFKAHQWNCRKPLRNTKHTQVMAHRYRCLKCQCTFRVYPTGISHDHQSDTLKGLSVLLYILGLSYQGVADLLEALQYPLSKTTAYENVQAAGTTRDSTASPMVASRDAERNKHPKVNQDTRGYPRTIFPNLVSAGSFAPKRTSLASST
jgi:hypothetical protein